MYCTQCGARLPEPANFCPDCGKPADGAAEMPVTTFGAPSRVEAPATAAAAQTAAADVARYAGFWRRVAASMIDGLIFAVILVPVVVVLFMAASPAAGQEPGVGFMAAYYLLSWGLGWLYYALQHSSAHQATFGKRALGIKVVSLQGERISFARATGRYFAYLLASFTLCIGLVMAAFTRRRQALHDFMAGTLVVSRGTTADVVVANGLAAPKVSGLVVAIGALVVMVPVLGILAAIAIPAYQDYVIRAQVAEGLNMASAIKASVAEVFARGTALEDVDSEAIGLDIESTGGKYVASLEVVSGAVVIVYGEGANEKLADRQLILVPGHTEQGDLVWTCGLAPIPDDVTPSVQAHAQYTDVERKYLPQACRP
jgi:uncharacterized RDD family membrane protein YckC/Tfp pilus assembly major pilin PilA